MDEILRQLDYIPGRIYNLWSMVIVVNVLFAPILIWMIREIIQWNKEGRKESFSDYIVPNDLLKQTVYGIAWVYSIITIVIDSFVIIGFLSGAVRLILF